MGACRCYYAIYLIEVGYITHPQEGPNIADDEYQNALAKGISDGIVAYFAKNPI
ncbi:MAG: N-acetylmuramoyl-L-alanine amidase [Campylobacter sp.]